jgi:hypothetical protein
LVIKGLPSGTKVEQLEGGVVRFGVRHLVIKVMRQSKQVLITDALNNREVRVDGAHCKVNIGEATIEAAGSINYRLHYPQVVTKVACFATVKSPN